MNLDNLPSESLTCGRCGDVRPWTDYTDTALERADGDRDPRLVCSACRRAKASRSRPITVQRKHKADSLRRAELRAVELRAAIDAASSSSVWSPVVYGPQELTRQLGETEAAILRHRAELAALQNARAHGESRRIALSRRTAHYAAPSSIHPNT